MGEKREFVWSQNEKIVKRQGRTRRGGVGMAKGRNGQGSIMFDAPGAVA